MKTPAFLAVAAATLLLCSPSFALDRPDTTFKIFQFPPDKIPRIDGKADDWAMIPDDYIIGGDQLVDDSGRLPKLDPKTLEVKVKVGWVKGENRLYFLYEATDDVCDYGQPGLHNDTFEIVVDGDKSGGNLLASNRPDKSVNQWDAWFTLQNVHAQNYHVMVPAVDKDWAMAWGPQAWWIKRMPWSNYCATCTAAPGKPGKVTAEFWITPFDHADAEGPEKSIPTKLVEGNTIGLSWAVMDYDDPKSNSHSFWNLSRHHTMYGDASELCAFRLMPLESQFRKPIEAQWSWSVMDMDRRLVAFKDLSAGEVTSWKWDFGDGSTSTERNPVHQYQKPGNLVVILEVSGPAGSSRRSKVWDVQLR